MVSIAGKVNRNVEWLVDDDGNVVGHRKKPGDDVAVITGSSQMSNAIAYLGDSQFMNNGSPLSVAGINSYNPATGVLSVSKAAHGLANGAAIRFAVRAARQWNVYAARVTVIDANNFSVVVASGLSGLPAAIDCRYNLMGVSRDESIVGHIQTLTGGRCRMVREAGMTGETWAELRLRYRTDIVPVLPVGGTLFINGGHNDALTGVPVAASISEMQGLVAEVVAGGHFPVILTCTPFASGYATTASRVHLLEQNRAIAAVADSARGIVVIDAFSVANDPASVCNALANYMQTDNLHWSGKTTKGIAQLAAPIINARYAAVPRLPQSSLDCYDVTNNPSSTNRMQNAVFATAAGGGLNNGITGPVAAQMNVATDTGSGANFTSSVPAASTGKGNAQKLAWTSTTFTNGVARMFSSSQHARFAPGDHVQIALWVKSTGLGGATNINYLSLFAYCTVDGVTQNLPIAHGSSMTGAYNDQTDFDGLMTGDFYIPTGAACTSVYFQLTAYLNGVGIVGSIQCETVFLGLAP